MKRTMAITLFSIATLFAAAGALAQDSGVKAKVPFQFTAGGKLLPAGVYTATKPFAGVLVIQSLDKSVTISTTYTANAQEEGAGAKWVFERYGEQYFLHSVLSPAMGMHASVPISSLEKRVNRQQASLGGGQVTLVAAN